MPRHQDGSLKRLPESFLRRMRERLGEAEFEAFERALAMEPLTSIRLNPAKTPDTLLTGLRGERLNEGTVDVESDVVVEERVCDAGSVGKNLQQSKDKDEKRSGLNGEREILGRVPWCEEGFYLAERPIFTLDPLLHGGAYYVQEPSSMFLSYIVKKLLPEGKPLRVLDLCAAPGGKSTLLASELPKGSLLVSNEVVRSRASILKENIIKWGSGNVVVTNSDPERFTPMEEAFDMILVDAPCSGEGMFRKEERAIEEWSEANLRLCEERQRRILSAVYPSLKRGGLLIYSTCTFNEGENEKMLHFMVHEFGAESVEVEHNFAGVERVGGKLSGSGVATKFADVNSLEVQSKAKRDREGALEAKAGRLDEVSAGESLYGYAFLPHRVAGEGFFIGVLRRPLVDSLSERTTHSAEGRAYEAMNGSDSRAGRDFKRKGDKGNRMPTCQERRGRMGRSAQKGSRGGETFLSLLKNPDDYSIYESRDGVVGVVPAEHAPFIAMLEEHLNIIYKGCEMVQMIGGGRDKFKLLPPLALFVGLNREKLHDYKVGQPSTESGQQSNKVGSHTCEIMQQSRECGVQVDEMGQDINGTRIHIYEAEREEALKFLRREDIVTNVPDGAWVLISYRGVGLGWGKQVGKRLNNHYPQGWRIRMDIKTPDSLLF